MAVGFLITRLSFCLLSMSFSSVFSTESLVPEEVAQKVYDYIQQKQPEITQLLGQLVKTSSQQQQTKSPAQQQPEASVKLPQEQMPQNNPLFNPQSYIPHLLTLAKLGSAIKGSDWAGNGKDGANSYKPNGFQIQDWIGSTFLPDQREIFRDLYGGRHTHDSTPRLRLSITFPGAHDHVDQDSSRRPDRSNQHSAQMELAKGKSTEAELKRPVFHQSSGQYYSQGLHPVQRHHHNPHSHYQHHGLGYHLPQFPRSHPYYPGHRGTSHNKPQIPPQRPVLHHYPGHHGTLHHKPQSRPHWVGPHPAHGSAHYRPQSPTHWAFFHAP